ncbi:hypothetical protein SO802_016042 [Lithocarpus litseifolius]|uniref:Uncharacterized protein n=1 Tax=Lithocarpus litseifolius TaxID=425828 RepID=A0AAW2CW29_9ROSI
MVGYSSVRVDCPSKAFLFACLGCLLEVVEGECLKWVSFFVGEDYLYRFVLSSLFPLVSRSARVARSLKIFGEVRSSELEMGLSSSDDRVIPEVTSPSTSYKTWNILCAFSEKDEKLIRDRKRLKVGDVSKDDLVVTPPSARSPAKHLTSPTLSLEVIASAGEETKKKKKALGESLFVFGKLLDFEKKVSTTEPMIKSFFAENETLKNKVVILAIEAENDKERVAALEKSLQVEKDFYELCESYVEGFKLFRKWMAKHHPDLDLSGLVMGDVEKELLSDRPFEVIVENVMEEATTIAEVTEEAATITPADPTLNE